MNLSKECLTVNITIGAFTGQKRDKEASRELATAKGAKADAVSVNKHTIPPSALKPITSAAGRARTHFYSQTLPWKDSGDRLLPRKAFQRFIETHEKLVAEHDDLVDAFISGTTDPKTGEFFCGYAAVREQAEFRMGGFFNENDYPSVASMKRKFYIKLDIDAVAKGFDIRLQNTDQVIQARVTKAMESLWSRVAKPLEHFAEAMKGEPTFRQPTIDTLREMVMMANELNFTGDPRMEQLAADIEKSLVAHDAKDLRENDQLRSDVGEEAERILETLRGFMGAVDQEGDDE